MHFWKNEHLLVGFFGDLWQSSGPFHLPGNSTAPKVVSASSQNTSMFLRRVEPLVQTCSSAFWCQRCEGFTLESLDPSFYRHVVKFPLYFSKSIIFVHKNKNLFSYPFLSTFILKARMSTSCHLKYWPWMWQHLKPSFKLKQRVKFVKRSGKCL